MDKVDVKIKEARPIAVKLVLLDKHESPDKISASIVGPISAGIEVDAKIGAETKKIRIQRIIVDPNKNPRIEIAGHLASTNISFPILNSIRKIFFFSRFLSIGHWIRKFGMSRGRRIAVSIVDWYIISWIIIEALLVTLLGINIFPHQLLFVVTIIAGYRIFELIQVYFNILLFDPLQHYEAGEEYFLYSSARSILISIISYVELIVCYGLIYFIYIDNGIYSQLVVTSVFETIYFSTILATIGYGDIVPIGNMRFVAMSEALLSVLFIATIIARFLNFLPSPTGKTWWR